MRSLVVLVVLLAGCKQDSPVPAAPPPPPPAPAPAPPPPAKRLGFADFWQVGGITRTDTIETIKAKWGEPKAVAHRDGTTLRYDGLSVDFRDDNSLQLDFAVFGDADRAAIAKHADAPLGLLGMTCADAAKRLSFTTKLEGYTTCKHYDKTGILVDVTLMCNETVDTLVVVWTPIPAGIEPVADHCNS